MDGANNCRACGKKCSMTDSRPYPNSGKKERVHNRCLLKYRIMPQSSKGEPKSHVIGAAISEQLTDDKKADESASDYVTRQQASKSTLLFESSAISDEVMERNRRDMNKLLEADKQKEANNQFFFDLKAGIAKPHEKKTFLYHKRLQDLKVSYDDNGFKTEAAGRSYDHRGKDLDNPSSSDSDSNSDGESGNEDEPHNIKQGGSHTKRVKLTDIRQSRDGHRTGKFDKYPDEEIRIQTRPEHSNRRRRDNQEQQQPCWFCLSSPNVEKHLIISIGDHCYLALAKGGLTDDHLLIIPIQHIRSTNDIESGEVLDEIEKFKGSLVDYFGSQSKAVIFFERNFRSTHLQIQVVPIQLDLLDEAEDKIRVISKKLYAPICYVPIPRNCTINDVIPRGQSYFLWEVEPIKSRFCSKIETKVAFFPMQFGRQVLANEDFLNSPDKIEWKRCAQTDEECKNIVKNLKESYKRFDFTLD